MNSDLQEASRIDVPPASLLVQNKRGEERRRFGGAKSKVAHYAYVTDEKVF